MINRSAAATLAALTAVILLAVLLPDAPATAQSGREITNGIVVGVATDADGRLEKLAVSESDGNIVEFTVEGSTEYGLETQAGDRWVSTQADEPVEVVSRLRDHQRRFAAVTVESQNGVAVSVVERESGNLETNLSFLFAVFAVTWAGFFAYIFFLSRKQRDLQRQVARLRASIKSGTDE